MPDIIQGKAQRIPNLPPLPGGRPVKPIVFWGGVLLLAAIAALWIADPFGNLGRARAPSVLVLDARVLLDAKAAQVGTLALADPAAAERETAQFVDRLKLELKKYGDAGYVVLNAGYVAHWPETVDITARIAADLGLDVGAVKLPTPPPPLPAPGSTVPSPAPLAAVPAAKPVLEAATASPPPPKGADRP